jgi:tetratricopeptide (TPR) repeat protein
MLAGQSGDAAAAAGWFREALAADPTDSTVRANLATALLSVGGIDEAAEVCSEGGPDARLLRLAGYAYQQQGRLEEASSAYQAVVAGDPADFETWNNLGNVRAGAGDTDGAVAAFERAIRLRPDLLPIYFNLAEVLAAADRRRPRQALLREAARRAPTDPHVQTELGLAEAAAQDFEAAERAYRTALRLDPGHLAAYVELGLLLETLNRLDDLRALLDQAAGQRLEVPEIAFLRAWALRRQGRFEEALALAARVPDTISPIRRFELLGELHDRLGNVPEAFAAYSRMNEASHAATAPLPGPRYPERVAANARLLTPEDVADWPPETATETPIFIIGFPRSGTTLLDTLLMNLPSLHVLEEQPMMDEVEALLCEAARLKSLSEAEVDGLRGVYLDTLARVSPPGPGQRPVDKYPLNMTRMPLVHRLFPGAPVVFVERHPCDSVLSGFKANFELNYAMRSFTSIEEAARTYDAAMEAWQRAEALLPLRVLRIRYERMVDDLEGEMRPLLAFLGLPWDPKVLDNRGSAERRGHVRTASYAQVGQAIHARSVGQWQRYREQMAPVLPILAPWAERMGYLV